MKKEAKVRVFISYGRKDSQFVDRLQAALHVRGVSATVDRQDIEKGEEWWARIRQLIIEADTLIFVLSPNSVASTVCKEEVDLAEKLNKRLVPVVACELEARAVPSPLARLNYIFFVPQPSTGGTGDFEQAVDELVRVLETDIAWIREHTRLGSLALRWDARKHPRDLLLRGIELGAAETWLTSRPANAPDPTDFHRAFVTQSRRAATGRQRTVMGLSMTAAVVALSLAGAAYWQSLEARQQRDEALAKESRLLAARSRASLENDEDPGLAMLLALAALPDEKGERRPYVPEAEASLYASFYRPQIIDIKKEFSGTISAAKESHLVAGLGQGVVYLWDARTGKGVREIKVDLGDSIGLSLKGSRLLTVSRARSEAVVLDVETGNILSACKRHKGDIIAGALSEERIFTASSDVALLWSSPNCEAGHILKGIDASIKFSEFTSDGKRLTIGAHSGKIQVWDAQKQVLLHEFNTNSPLSVSAHSMDGSLFARSAPVPTVHKTDDPNREWMETVELWDMASGKRVEQIGRMPAAITAIRIAPDKQTLYIALGNGKIAALKTTSNKQFGEFIGHDATPGPNEGNIAIVDAQLANSGKVLITQSESGDVYFWNVDFGHEIATVDGDPVALNTDGTKLVTTDGRVTDLPSGRRAFRYSLNLAKDEIILSAQFHRLGLIALTHTSDKTVQLHRTGRIRSMHSIGSSDSKFADARLSVDGSIAYTLSSDGLLEYWRLSTREKFGSLNLGRPARSIRFVSSDNHLVLIDSTMWNLNKGAVVKTLQTNEAISFSPTGDRYAIVNGNKITVRKSEDDEPIFMFEGDDHNERFSSFGVLFSPNGQRVLVTGGTAGRSSLLDAKTGVVVAELKGSHLGEGGASALFSAGGAFAVFGASDHESVGGSPRSRTTVFRLFSSTQAMVEAAKSQVTACLTARELVSHLGRTYPPRWCIESGKRPYEGREWKEWLERTDKRVAAQSPGRGYALTRNPWKPHIRFREFEERFGPLETDVSGDLDQSERPVGEINAVGTSIPKQEPPLQVQAEGDVPSFKWPVTGDVISTFGPQATGHNDGINIAVPRGIDVVAAESGKVAYAGNEIRGYGNLILLKHSNGWITAYAHLDQTLVKQAQEVKRGQVIARAGMTGAVDRPQLHFEIRQGSIPIDPLPLMEK